MNNSGLIHEANETLRDLKRKQMRMSKQFNTLKNYEGWILIPEKRKRSSRTYYSVIRKGAKKKSYLGGERNDHVLNVKRFRYAKKALSVFDHDIELIEMLLNKYIQTDYSTLNSMLPAAYQTNLQNTDSTTTNMPKEALAWKKSLENEKAKYPPYKPEQLKHEALDGTMMRSKSEVIIANMLILAGIPFVYEVPIFINGEMLLPDFTILSLIDLKTVIIIEHQGMVYVDEYADKFIKSLKLYLKSDWIPNKNLFFTFDNARETLDPNQVTSILRKYVSPDL